MIHLYLKIPEVILQDRFWVVYIPFVRMIKFKFLAQFRVDHLLTQSCLVLYSFCGNLLHLLIMWLIISSLSPHKLFYCVLSILALIWLVLIALFCIASRRDSVSVLRFLFLSHTLVFSREILLISRLKYRYVVFLPILFSVYCHPFGPRAVSSVSGVCNQSFSTLLSSSCCNDA